MIEKKTKIQRRNDLGGVTFLSVIAVSRLVSSSRCSSLKTFHPNEMPPGSKCEYNGQFSRFCVTVFFVTICIGKLKSPQRNTSFRTRKNYIFIKSNFYGENFTYPIRIQTSTESHSTEEFISALDSKASAKHHPNGAFKFQRKHTLRQFEQKQLPNLSIPDGNVQFQNDHSSVSNLGSIEIERHLDRSARPDQSV